MTHKEMGRPRNKNRGMQLHPVIRLFKAIHNTPRRICSRIPCRIHSHTRRSCRPSRRKVIPRPLGAHGTFHSRIRRPRLQGHLTLELANVGKLPVRLYPGMRVCQIVFHRMESPAEAPYGSKHSSKYQDEIGATQSRINIDADMDWVKKNTTFK